MEAGVTSLRPLELSEVTLGAGESVDFNVFFRPIESGPHSAAIVVEWGEGYRYVVTMNARGRDNATLSPAVKTVADLLYSKRPSSTLVGAAVGTPAGGICFSQNVNEWSDTFAENIAVTCLNADGGLAWSKEWAEDFEQLQPDPGQNGEAGGGAESLAYGAEGAYPGPNNEDHYWVAGTSSTTTPSRSPPGTARGASRTTTLATPPAPCPWQRRPSRARPRTRSTPP